MMRSYLSDGFGKVNNSRIEIGPKLVRMVLAHSNFNYLIISLYTKIGLP